MSKKFTNPKTIQTLNEMKYEIARELRINDLWKEKQSTPFGQNIFFNNKTFASIAAKVLLKENSSTYP